MARVTVEDCVVQVPNRFELVVLAAQRARSVSAGAELTVERDNDKNPVVALREIAERTVNFDELQQGVVKSLQKYVESDEPETDEMDALAFHQETPADAAGEEAGIPGDAADESSGDAMGLEGESSEADDAGEMMFEDASDEELAEEEQD